MCALLKLFVVLFILYIFMPKDLMVIFAVVGGITAVFWASQRNKPSPPVPSSPPTHKRREPLNPPATPATPKTINADWNISVSFSKSRSTNFERALFLAREAPKFEQFDNAENTVYQVTFSAQPHDYMRFVKLYEMISGWKSTHVMICGELVDRKIVSNLNYCYGDRIRSGNPDFCYGASHMTANPFGCHRLQISACNNPWIKFFRPVGDGSYKLDKKDMKARIDSFAAIYRHCPVFDYGEILLKLELLPDIVSGREYHEIYENENGPVLSAEEADTINSGAWLHNPTIHKLFQGQDEETTNKILNAIKVGYAGGETNSQIKQRIDKLVESSAKNEALPTPKIIAQTAALAMANTARLEMYRKNSDGILCIRWLAALDLRTCIECAELDGKYWDLDGNPIGHEIPFVPPPIHYNCRCTLVPVTSLDAELDENGNVVDKRTPLSTRASKDGQVPATWSFEKWFDSLSEEEQERYLGTSRFTLMKSGEISFSDLVNKKGKIKTILELGHPEMPDDLPPQNQPAPKKSRRKRKPQEQQTNSSA